MTGIEDPELAQLIEDRAANEPDDVIAALKDKPPPIRIQAARLVGEMSEREFGPERKNMITALTGILEEMAPAELKASLGDLLRNVQSYRSQEPLTLPQMPGALVLALVAPEGAKLRQEILTQGDLLATPVRLAGVARLLPSLDDSESEPVERAVARHTAADPEIILDCLRSHPPVTVARLIRVGHSELVAAVKPPAESPDSAASAAPEPPASERKLTHSKIRSTLPKRQPCWSDSSLRLSRKEAATSLRLKPSSSRSCSVPG
jgi:hypothetical protein